MTWEKWKKSNCNMVLEIENDVYVSYTSCKFLDFPSWGSDNGSDETTLVDNREDRKYYILNGDFRKEYERVFDKGFNACKEFYDSMKDKHQSTWSSDY